MLNKRKALGFFSILVFFSILGYMYMTETFRRHVEKRPFSQFRYVHVKGKNCSSNRKRSKHIAMFNYWDSFARRHGIEYILAYGTLLGQYRNKDVIPWDGDMDILVNEQYFTVMDAYKDKRNFSQGRDNKFHLVIQPEFVNVTSRLKRRRWNCPGKIVSQQVDSCAFVGPMARLVYGSNHLDFFQLVNKGNMIYDENKGKYYNRGDIYPLVQCTYMGLETWCPRNSEKILKIIYGNIDAPRVCIDGKWEKESKQNVVKKL